ncbi:MAG TPA: O-antigen ligase family protein [bacterium]|nr:O-antigen ligase family protein [bacterium]
MNKRLEFTATAGLWLFGAVALLSIAAQNVLFVGLAAWVVLALRGRGGRLPQGPFVWLYLAFLAWALLASALSDNAAHSAETWRKWLLVFGLLYASAWLGQRPRDLRSVAIACLGFSGVWALGASLWALHGPVQALLHGSTAQDLAIQWLRVGDWRAVSGSGGYMVLGTGSMLALVVFGSAALQDDCFRRPWALASLAALALALLLTLTRSAWLGAAAGGALLLVLNGRWRVLLGLGLGLAVLAVLPGSPVARRLQQGTEMSEGSTRERVYMAQAGAAIIRDHPWLGVGDAMASFDGHDGYYRRYRSAEAAQDPVLKGNDQGHLHDDFIMLGALYGLPGLLLMLAAFAALLPQLWRGRRARGLAGGLALGALAAAVAWWVNGLFEYNFGSFQSSFVLWFLLGLGLAGAQQAGTLSASPPSSTQRRERP